MAIYISAFDEKLEARLLKNSKYIDTVKEKRVKDDGTGKMRH